MMTLMNAKILSILLVFISLDVPVHAASTEVIPEIPEDLLLAAEQIYRDRIISNAEIMKTDLPYFSEMDDLSNFELGNPFPRYKLHTEIVYSMKDTSRFIDALELLVWAVPINIKSGKGFEPRTLLGVKRETEGSWRFGGCGGYVDPIRRAKKRWPPEDGYRYASVRFSDPKISLVMIERKGDLKFWFYDNDNEGGNRIFGLTRKEDGSWPAISKNYLFSMIKSDKYYSKTNESGPPKNMLPGYRPSVIAIENEYSTYKAPDGSILDSMPEIIHYEKPDYPMLARQAGIEGAAVLEVTIGVNGRVESAKIINSKVTPGMENSLLEAAMKFVYQPGRRGSKPIKCIATHLVTFTLNDDVIQIDIK